jgi:hypothetical protein
MAIAKSVIAGATMALLGYYGFIAFVSFILPM